MRVFLMRTITKVQNLWYSRRADEELEREIAAHLALLEEECERRRMPRERARTTSRHTCLGQPHRLFQPVYFADPFRFQVVQVAGCRSISGGFHRLPGCGGDRDQKTDGSS